MKCVNVIVLSYSLFFFSLRIGRAGAWLVGRLPGGWRRVRQLAIVSGGDRIRTVQYDAPSRLASNRMQGRQEGRGKNDAKIRRQETRLAA